MSLATQLLADALVKADTEFKGIGSAKSGYAPPNLGPFKCVNCIHYDADRCDHPEVISDPQVKGVVKANGCCNFFRGSK